MVITKVIENHSHDKFLSPEYYNSIVKKVVRVYYKHHIHTYIYTHKVLLDTLCCVKC